MRTTPAAQPGVDLSDDPDLVADLGQRMASTAHTAQGALANYLFHGERLATAADRDERAASSRMHGKLATLVAMGTAIERPAPNTADVGDHADVRELDTAAEGSRRTRGRVISRRLALRVVSPSDPIDSKVGRLVRAADAAGTSAMADPLATDGLGDDGLAQGQTRMSGPSVAETPHSRGPSV